MDKISALTSFVHAVKLGSFSAAAAHLGISQPAVSQQVRTLEETLGTRLITRTTRRLSMTEAGERYFAYACDILEQIAEADRSVQSAEAQMSGRLAVSLPVGFAETVLAEFVVGFKKAHPDIFLDIQLTDDFVDLQKERVDVAIRMGDIRDERLIVKKLGEAHRCFVASPDYLDRRGRPATPADLKHHDFLLYPRTAADGQLALQGTCGKRTSIPVSPVMVINNSATLRHAALSGLGISPAVSWLAKPHLDSGALEVILPDWMYPAHPIHAVYPSNRYIPLKVRRFVSDMTAFFNAAGAFCAPPVSSDKIFSQARPVLMDASTG
ncbi:transcriptional regulator, LysR family [Roseibium hamelinense]|uniref:Transcriptional regulator, LysR family n=1 Tax=Roseibium hamelinense TaxID=150831 RepID=A0A562T7P5_9HYPH|nr:LysR family transcriptional regulator [Roseibium hamelinense]MTI42105.1 LysR family transcriptional regulator [Roseibium hamelinense]TWI89532.1 transcriptional regulator, LysR family [Roseibium hamelinense]